MVSEKNTRFQVKLSKEVAEKIKKRAEKEKRSISNFIAKCIEKEFEK